MYKVSDCNGLTRSVYGDKWQLRASETTKASGRDISMLRSCFEKGNEFHLVKTLDFNYLQTEYDTNENKRYECIARCMGES